MRQWTWMVLVLGLAASVAFVAQAQWILDGTTWQESEEPVANTEDPPEASLAAALVINLAGPILHDPDGDNLHFEVQWSANYDFSDAVSYSTTTNTSGWFFFNGTGYQPLPAHGFESEFYYVHEGLGSVVLAAQETVATNVYVRARSHNGVDWSDYRTAYGSGTVTVNPSGAVAGARAVANSQDASIENVGTIRYREDGSSTYVEMSMLVGPGAYAWVELVSNVW